MSVPHTSSAAAVNTSAPRTTSGTSSATEITTEQTTISAETTQDEIIITASGEAVITAESETSAITAATTQEITEESDIANSGRQSNNPSLIILLVTFVLCGIAALAYYLIKNKRTVTDVSQKTAQDFVNVRDTGNDCLYTVDGKIFIYLKINGIATELYSERELDNIARNMSAGLVGMYFPYKIISVSKPVEIKNSLQLYTKLQETADDGRKALLQQEMKELIKMIGNGDTFERQHYAVFWGDLADEEKVRKNASDFLKVLQENSVSAEILDPQGIVELCNLVNIPEYVRVENRDDFTNELLNAIIK